MLHHRDHSLKAFAQFLREIIVGDQHIDIVDSGESEGQHRPRLARIHDYHHPPGFGDHRPFQQRVELTADRKPGIFVESAGGDKGGVDVDSSSLYFLGLA